MILFYAISFYMYLWLNVIILTERNDREEFTREEEHEFFGLLFFGLPIILINWKK